MRARCAATRCIGPLHDLIGSFLQAIGQTKTVGQSLQPLRCQPPPCASNFSFLHLAVIEEDRAYDSKGSDPACRVSD
jgi:hypothetical protein